MASSKPVKRAKSSKPKRAEVLESKSEQVSFDLKPNTKVQITIETGSLKAGKMPVTIHMGEEPREKPTRKVAAKPKAAPWFKTSWFTTPWFETSRFKISWFKWDALASLLGRYSLATWLFALAVGMYLITRLIGLTHFPIYFFTDEAIQTYSIHELISNHYRDINGVLLPPYFRNGDYTNLSLSVYLQWIPLLLFGKSAIVTRVTSVLITLIAAISVGLILKDAFHSKYWWAGTLFLSITPSWYLHSRTAFETAEFTAFYAGTLCAYLYYRFKSPNYLYLVFLLAALAFYSYSPGQLIVPVTALALVISDWRYHWQNRQTAFRGLFLLAILAIPYLRYRQEYPSAAFSHLYTLSSYLVEDIPLSEKITRYLSEYSVGLSTWYWYKPNNRDLSRHLMKDYANILIATLPFAILGLARILNNLRNPAHRTILIAMLAAPVSGALVGVSITRVLIFVIPAAILTTLGLERALGWLENPTENIERNNQTRPKVGILQVITAITLLACGVLIFKFVDPTHTTDRIVGLVLAVLLSLQVLNAFQFLVTPNGLTRLAEKLRRWVIPQALTALIVFLILCTTNIFMLYDALKNGPLWFKDYGMGGMQYGAFQVFDIIKEYKQEHPQTNIIFSPNWTNGANTVAAFFLDYPLPFEIASPEGHIVEKLPLDEHTLFVMTPDEYKLVSASEKLTDLNVEKIIPYPDGTPGFYFVRMRYADQADEMFAAEKALRDVPRQSVVTIDGQLVKVKHTFLDAGDQKDAQQNAINEVFDNDLFSLAKTFEANPFVIELTFPSPRILNGFSIIIGSARAHITLKCYTTADAEPIIYTFDGQGSSEQPELSYDLPQPTEVQVLQIEMFDPNSPPPTKIHIWEIILR